MTPAPAREHASTSSTAVWTLITLISRAVRHPAPCLHFCCSQCCRCELSYRHHRGRHHHGPAWSRDSCSGYSGVEDIWRRQTCEDFLRQGLGFYRPRYHLGGLGSHCLCGQRRARSSSRWHVPKRLRCESELWRSAFYCSEHGCKFLPARPRNFKSDEN
jgi:hypothetical protein